MSVRKRVMHVVIGHQVRSGMMMHLRSIWILAVLVSSIAELVEHSFMD